MFIEGRGAVVIVSLRLMYLYKATLLHEHCTHAHADVCGLAQATAGVALVSKQSANRVSTRFAKHHCAIRPFDRTQ